MWMIRFVCFSKITWIITVLVKTAYPVKELVLAKMKDVSSLLFNTINHNTQISFQSLANLKCFKFFLLVGRRTKAIFLPSTRWVPMGQFSVIALVKMK